MAYRRTLGESGLGMSAAATAGATGAAPATGGLSLLIPTILGSLGSIGSFLSGSNPKQDAERKARIDTDFAGAMAGDEVALANLMCKAGHVTQLAVDHGLIDSAGGCSLAGGSKIGQAYANQRWLEYKARALAGNVGVNLIGQSPLPGQIGTTVRQIATSPLLIGGVVVIAYLLLRKKR